MHFAYTSRKSSRPPPPNTSRSLPLPYLRRARLKQLAWVLFGVTVLWLVLRTGSKSSRRRAEPIPAGTPSVVLVTVMDAMLGPSYERIVRDNRETYASMHGYATFFANTTSYDLSNPQCSKSWAKVPAMRHAMATHKYSQYFFYLSPTSLIMNPTLTLEAHIMQPARLNTLMIGGQPIVPPDSVIRTFSNRKGEHIDFVITQDSEGLSPDTFIVRRGEWAKYLLDSWFDPLYRSYNFQRAEGHALEHLVQWHSTVLSRLAIVPQKIMNSYYNTPKTLDAQYADGDFIATMRGCERITSNPHSGRTACEDYATDLAASVKAKVN